MEDLLLNIVKEASGPKLLSLKQSAQEAHGKPTTVICKKNTYCTVTYVYFVDLLNSQCTGLLRSPSYELRSICFKPLRLALESKRTKLVSLALNGLHVRK